MSTEQQHLAGAIRNHLASPGIVFSPMRGVRLSYRDGMLCKVTGDNTNQHYHPLFAQEEVYEMSDSDLWTRVVDGEQQEQEDTQELPATRTRRTRSRKDNQ